MGQYIQGKGNLLDEIRKINPTLTGEYIRLSSIDPDIERKAIGFMGRFEKGTQFILRSDSSCEDYYNGEKVVTFAGMFDSIIISRTNQIKPTMMVISYPLDLATGNKDKLRNLIKDYFDSIKSNHIPNPIIDSTAERAYSDIEKKNYLDKLKITLGRFDIVYGENHRIPFFQIIERSNAISKYANFRGIDLSNSNMDFILHKKYDGDLVLISEHPNIDGRVHIETSDHKLKYWMSEDIFFKDLSTLNPEKQRLIRLYADAVNQLRKNGIIPHEFAIVAEGQTESDKIFQIRPFFKKDLYKNHHPEIIGRIPDEGLEFTINSNKEGYINLYYSLSQQPLRMNALLPIDVENNELIQLLIIGARDNTFLSHAGLKNIESIISYDASLRSCSTFRSMAKAKRIRYFEKQNNVRAFEILEK